MILFKKSKTLSWKNNFTNKLQMIHKNKQKTLNKNLRIFLKKNQTPILLLICLLWEKAIIKNSINLLKKWSNIFSRVELKESKNLYKNGVKSCGNFTKSKKCFYHLWFTHAKILRSITRLFTSFYSSFILMKFWANSQLNNGLNPMRKK